MPRSPGPALALAGDPRRPTGADPFGHKRPQKATTMQTISAHTLFAPVAEQIRRTSTPTARGEAIAITIEQLALLARPELRYSPALMRQAYLTLAAHIEGEVPQVAARRQTCLEIADAIGAAHNLGPRPGPDAHAADLAAVLSWWGVALLAPGDHPRWLSIRETAGRELSELERAIAEDRPKAPTGPRLLEIVRAEMITARQAGQKHAHIELGVPREPGRDGGPARQDAMATLRAEGYRVELDGRS
jgi:hypothetical protein